MQRLYVFNLAVAENYSNNLTLTVETLTTLNKSNTLTKAKQSCA